MTDGHLVQRTLTESVWYPPHEARRASTLYKAVHKHLVYELDEPCWICGVRQSEQAPRVHNETHHVVIEWALANGIDPFKLASDVDPHHVIEADSADAWLRQWLDGEGNMLVLCPAHHRHGLVGIHSITYPAWVAQRWLKSGHDISHRP